MPVRRRKKAAGLSKKVSEKRTYAYDEETRGTTLAGKNVKVIGQKVHMTATQAHALQDVIISGTRGVTIEGAVENLHTLIMSPAISEASPVQPKTGR